MTDSIEGTRRLRTYAISAPLVFDWMFKRHDVFINASIPEIPTTAIFCNAKEDFYNRRILVMFSDDSFDEVPVGEEIPIIVCFNPEVRQIPEQLDPNSRASFLSQLIDEIIQDLSFGVESDVLVARIKRSLKGGHFDYE